MNSFIMAFLIAIGVSIVIGPLLIPLLRRLKFGQHIRQEGPKAHFSKAGTPTMGGVMFLLSIPAGAFLTAGVNEQTLMLTGALVGFGMIGFIDDFTKIVWKRNLGLTAKQKLLGQLLLAFILLGAAQVFLDRGTDLYIPFINTWWSAGWLYYALTALLIVGTTNAVNLTDGLDGLVSGVTFWVALGFFLIASGEELLASAHFATALAGGCLGFLFFNRYPAKVFMGDTGSLALGAAIAGLSIITRSELLLIIMGAVYVAETLSVILQVISFKTTGKRIFRMSPLHHHFELGGWSEQRVVWTFWTASFVATAMGTLLALNIRF